METKRRVNGRTIWLGIGITLLFVGLITRLWWLQSVEAAWIIDKANQQWQREKVLKPKRGSILDRNGQVLAYEGKAYTVEAKIKPTSERDEDYVRDPYMTARTLSPILGVPVEKLLGYLTHPQATYVELGREGKKITEDQKKAILSAQFPKLADGTEVKKNQLPGIILRETTRRYYPNNSFASHVLGYLDYDDNARMGIELQFDKELRGEQGELHVIKDAAGFQLPEGEQKYKPAKDGLDVVLTIDQQIQDYVEQALDQAEQQFHPKKMSVIVADPKTGEILAMGNRSQFNPNTYWQINNYLNHSISSIFEPGSTFKIITLAAAIEEGVFNPNEEYMSGVYTKIPGARIQDHNGGRGWGKISFLKGVQYSSNVAFVILGYERLKQDLLSKYFDLFGIGKKTGIELPGEEEGMMVDLKNPRSQRDVAVTTFGQGVAVTAIQQVAAVGAIANGGELLKPHIVKELRDSRTGAVVKRYQRDVVGRVVSEKTAKQVRDILETVVTGEGATGRWFYLDGYHVAGKTGTAQKYDEATGKIIPGSYIASFIGFAPKDDPRLLVYVVVDDPQADYTELSSYVVAPIFKHVMEKSLQYLRLQPDMTQSKAVTPVKERVMPKLVGMSTSLAEVRAREEGFEVMTVGTGTKIVKQFPQAYEQVIPGSRAILVTDRVTNVKMPDFTGKSLREVMEFASLIQLKVIPEGSGFVQSQNIPPGTAVTEKDTLRVQLAPAGAAQVLTHPADE